MKNVDEIIRKRYARKQDAGPITHPQVALVAMNPAYRGRFCSSLVDVRYGASQPNHDQATSDRIDLQAIRLRGSLPTQPSMA